LLALLGLLLVAMPTHAGPAEHKRQAKTLALQAIQLYHAGRPTEAYAKLEEAEALHQSVTHRVYLARCLDAMGRLVEAEARYQALADEPREPKLSYRTRAAYAAAAKEHATLKERVPRLTLVVNGAPEANLTVTIGERALDYPGPETAIPVDPGPGELRVEGEGLVAATERFTAVEGEAVEASVMMTPADMTASPEAQEGSLTPAIVAYGVGGAALTMAAVAGGLAIAQANDVKAQCIDFRCPSELRDEADRSQTLGTVSTVGFVVGGAAVAAGVVLTVVRPGGGTRDEMGLVPLVGPGWVGLRGRF